MNYEIARYALQRGLEVTLLADTIAPDLQELGASWIPIHPSGQRVNLLKVRSFMALSDRALERSERGYEVVHGNGCTLARPHHINTAHFVHGAWLKSPVHVSRVQRNLYGGYQWLYSVLNARWERQVYKAAQIVVAVSHRVRRQLIEIGVPSVRILTVLNGVDLKEFHPGCAKRNTLGLLEKVPLALFVGDIRSPRKNLDTVLRAMHSLPGLHLAVVGDSSASPYPALAARLGVSERVHFLGYRKDVPELMRAADMFIFPSRYEACSLVLLEALASGLPVITAQTAGGAEVITRESGFVLEDPDNTPELAAAMRTILNDDGRRRCMGEAARAVAEGYSWSRMADTYIEQYLSVNK